MVTQLFTRLRTIAQTDRLSGTETERPTERPRERETGGYADSQKTARDREADREMDRQGSATVRGAVRCGARCGAVRGAVRDAHLHRGGWKIHGFRGIVYEDIGGILRPRSAPRGGRARHGDTLDRSQ